jgi:hypothetical protein
MFLGRSTNKYVKGPSNNFFIRNPVCQLGAIFVDDSCMTRIFVFVVHCQSLTQNSSDTAKKRIPLINRCSVVVDIKCASRT